MKIELARSIALRKILFKLGLEPIKESSTELVYCSPFTDDKSIFLYVNVIDNLWLDEAINDGGNSVDFVCAYLKHSNVSHNIPDGLRWMKNIMCEPLKIDLDEFPNHKKNDAGYRKKSVRNLSNIVLLRYLDNRMIQRDIALRYIKEVEVQDSSTNETTRTIGIKNEDGGYMVRNPYVKMHIGKPTISFIRGNIPKPPGIHIFKDVFDFLSILTVKKIAAFDGDTVILNSYSCLNDVMPYIAKYGYSTVKTWLPNDATGQAATNALDLQFQQEEGLKHERMNKLYAPYVSPNEWLIATDKRIR